MSKGERSLVKFLFGTISGLISGFILGLLFAPKTGRKLREDLLNKSKDLQDLTRSKLFNFQQYGRGKAQEASASISKKTGKISLRLDELARRGTDVLIQDEIQ